MISGLCRKHRLVSPVFLCGLTVEKRVRANKPPDRGAAASVVRRSPRKHLLLGASRLRAPRDTSTPRLRPRLPKGVPYRSMSRISTSARGFWHARTRNSPTTVKTRSWSLVYNTHRGRSPGNNLHTKPAHSCLPSDVRLPVARGPRSQIRGRGELVRQRRAGPLGAPRPRASAAAGFESATASVFSASAAAATSASDARARGPNTSRRGPRRPRRPHCMDRPATRLRASAASTANRGAAGAV